MLHLLLIKLIFAHYLADYPLQGDFLAAAKNHRKPFPGVPWYQALIAHSAIQAGFVWLITGSLWIAGIEIVAHAAIDYLKCDGRISYNTDQCLHLFCKVAYVAILMVAK
jgi:hypothetical protein